MFSLSANDRSEWAEVNPAEDPRWDDFVLKHPEGTPYHHSAWTQVICETYGHTPLFLALVSPDDGHIEGILPFVYINSYLTGKRLISLPFTSYCDPLVPRNRLAEGLQIASRRFRRVRYVELKQLKNGDNQVHDLEFVESPYVCQILSLRKDLKGLFQSFHESCVRRRVRHAEKSGLVFQMADSEKELRRVYQMFVEVRQKHGLPSAPYKFFLKMYQLLTPKDLLELPLVISNGSIVAAALILKSSAMWHLEYIVSDVRFNHQGSNQFLIWECIKRAHELGAKHFDFGRTSLSHQSLLEYKGRWGTESRPISHCYYPANAVSPLWHDFSNSFLTRLNKRMPLQIVRLEGRLIYPHKS